MSADVDHQEQRRLSLAKPFHRLVLERLQCERRLDGPVFLFSFLLPLDRCTKHLDPWVPKMEAGLCDEPTVRYGAASFSRDSSGLYTTYDAFDLVRPNPLWTIRKSFSFMAFVLLVPNSFSRGETGIRAIRGSQ